jgi:hypothetical protein
MMGNAHFSKNNSKQGDKCDGGVCYKNNRRSEVEKTGAGCIGCSDTAIHTEQIGDMAGVLEAGAKAENERYARQYTKGFLPEAGALAESIGEAFGRVQAERRKLYAFAPDPGLIDRLARLRSLICGTGGIRKGGTKAGSEGGPAFAYTPPCVSTGKRHAR